jgi:hypothetical protein
MNFVFLRRTLAISIGSGALAVGGLAQAVPAHAATVIQCLATGSTTWSPGLGETADPQDWNAQINFSDCIAVGLDGDATLPTKMVGLGTETNGCNDVVTNHKGSGTVTWADGTTGAITVAEISDDSVDGDDSGTIEDTITSGPHHVGAHITDVDLGEGSGCPKTSEQFTVLSTID